MQKKLFLSSIILLVFLLTGCTKLERLTLEPETTHLLIGETLDLALTYEPVELKIENLDLQYSSNNDEIATVDENGTVTTLSEGNVTITVNGKNKIQDTCDICVIDPSPLAELYIGDSIDIFNGFILLDENSDNIIWTSSNEDSVSIDENGKVTGTNLGNSIIKASVGNIVEVIGEVTVIKKPNIESISIHGKDELYLKNNHKYTVEISPELYEDERIVWTSSDESIISITKGNGFAIAVGLGTATITATTEDTGISNSIEITVTPIPPMPLKISTGFSGSKSIIGSNYNMAISITADATGGTETGYQYKFEIIQNGNTTRNTGWGNENSISATLNGSGTCELEVSVKDSSGEIVTKTINLLTR